MTTVIHEFIHSIDGWGFGGNRSYTRKMLENITGNTINDPLTLYLFQQFSEIRAYTQQVHVLKDLWGRIDIRKNYYEASFRIHNYQYLRNSISQVRKYRNAIMDRLFEEKILGNKYRQKWIEGFEKDIIALFDNKKFIDNGTVYKSKQRWSPNAIAELDKVLDFGKGWDSKIGIEFREKYKIKEISRMHYYKARNKFLLGR